MTMDKCFSITLLPATAWLTNLTRHFVALNR